MNTARKIRLSVNVLGVMTDVAVVNSAPPSAATAAPSPRPTSVSMGTRMPVASTAAGTSFIARSDTPHGLRRSRSTTKPTSEDEDDGEHDLAAVAWDPPEQESAEVADAGLAAGDARVPS